MNPLRQWFEQDPKPMTRREFARRLGITTSYLCMLLEDTPPWPSRRIMRGMVYLTKGAVTPEAWMNLPDRRAA